jgi:hypothetical protein
MRTREIAVLTWIVTLAVCAAGEPERAKGFSVHMLAGRAAQIDGSHGGFTAKAADGTESTYADAKQLVAFFQTLSAPTQENGIWVVTTHPSSYSESERTTLKALITLCDEKKIPVFTCRGSEEGGQTNMRLCGTAGKINPVFAGKITRSHGRSLARVSKIAIVSESL